MRAWAALGVLLVAALVAGCALPEPAPSEPTPSASPELTASASPPSTPPTAPAPVRQPPQEEPALRDYGNASRDLRLPNLTLAPRKELVFRVILNASDRVQLDVSFEPEEEPPQGFQVRAILRGPGNVTDEEGVPLPPMGGAFNLLLANLELDDSERSAEYLLRISSTTRADVTGWWRLDGEARGVD